MRVSVPRQSAGESVYRLIYCSNMAITGGPSVISRKVSEIVNFARIRNKMHGITGALFADGESFSQVLEGPARAVKDLFVSIYQDNRHCDVTLLESGFVAQREFPNWSMAYAGSLDSADVRAPSGHMMSNEYLLGNRSSATLNLLLYVLKENHTSPMLPFMDTSQPHNQIMLQS